MVVKATTLSDGRGRLPSEYVFVEGEPAEVEALFDDPYPEDVPYGCLLLETNDAVILVDTGIGAVEHPFGGSGGALQAELGRLGVSREAVDVVVVTHGHLDHVGGNVTEGGPAFPRARYVMAGRDWERWTTEDALAQMPPATADIVRNQLLPLEANGVLDLLEGETEIAPGILVLPAPGHTPGHLAVEVADELLYLDGLVPASAPGVEAGVGARGRRRFGDGLRNRPRPPRAGGRERPADHRLTPGGALQGRACGRRLRRRARLGHRVEELGLAGFRRRSVDEEDDLFVAGVA